MNSHDLTPEQAHAITERIRESLSYLHRLKARMEAERFPLTDEIYRATVKAHDAMHELSVRMHYLACDAGRRAK